MKPEDCYAYSKRVASIVGREARRCDCALLSGGVDTTFVVAASGLAGSLTAITVDLGGSDAVYAAVAARKLGVKRHTVVRASRYSFMSSVDWVLENLRVIDPVEVAADAVHHLALSKAKAIGCSCVLSGDGGDEMFAGYDFLLDLSDDELARWLSRMARSAWLPTLWVGGKLGVRVVAPLYSAESRREALRAPLDCLLDRGRRVGKFLLRLFLDALGLGEIAWRRKTPVTAGSGALAVLESLSSSASLGELLKAAKRIGVAPPSTAHAFLAWRMLELGVEAPPLCADSGSRCPVCGRCLRGGWCSFCGAVLSGGRLQAYSGP